MKHEGREEPNKDVLLEKYGMSNHGLAERVNKKRDRCRDLDFGEGMHLYSAQSFSGSVSK